MAHALVPDTGLLSAINLQSATAKHGGGLDAQHRRASDAVCERPLLAPDAILLEVVFCFTDLLACYADAVIKKIRKTRIKEARGSAEQRESDHQTRRQTTVVSYHWV